MRTPETSARYPVAAEDFVYIDTIKTMVEQLASPTVRWAHTDQLPQTLAGLTREDVAAARKTHSGRLTFFCGESDAGIALQDEKHPNSDLFRAAIYGVDWENTLKNRTDYIQVRVGPTCCPERCDQNHRYSVRMERFTYGTFPAEVSRLVDIFAANLDTPLADPLYFLPFGLNNDDGQPGKQGQPGKRSGRQVLAELVAGKPPPKKGLLYVNFQGNNAERLTLLDHYRKQPWVTFRENVPVEQYLAEMAEHHFVLSPPGNGMDCYRNYEAFYLGCRPVVGESRWAAHFSACFPELAVVADNLAGIAEGQLRGQLSLLQTPTPADYECATASYWKRVLEELC